jgi:hypothetical protein
MLQAWNIWMERIWMWLVLFPEGPNSSAIPTSGFQLLQQEEEQEKKQVHYRCAGHKEDGTGDAP